MYINLAPRFSYSSFYERSWEQERRFMLAPRFSYSSFYERSWEQESRFMLAPRFSYSSFYEPSVVNAAEGGLQQLFNLLLAVLSSLV